MKGGLRMGCIPERIFLNDQIFLEFRSKILSGKAGLAVDYLVKTSRKHAAANKMFGSIRSGMENTEKIVAPYVSLIWIPAAASEGVQ